MPQQGCPLDLYDKPVNKFVAGFIGSPGMNFIPAIGGEDGQSVALDLGERQSIELGYKVQPGRNLIAGLRPEQISVVPPGTAMLKVAVGTVEYTGAATHLTTASTPELVVVSNGRAEHLAGEIIGLDFQPAHLHLFEAQTELRLEADQ